MLVICIFAFANFFFIINRNVTGEDAIVDDYTHEPVSNVLI